MPSFWWNCLEDLVEVDAALDVVPSHDEVDDDAN